VPGKLLDLGDMKVFSFPQKMLHHVY